MTSYTVQWTTGVDADSPREAAEKALAQQRDPDSIAVVFDVFEGDDDESVEVDLLEPVHSVNIKTRVLLIRAGCSSAELCVAPLVEGATLADLQRHVGGYLEEIPLGSGLTLLVNEDGKTSNLPLNPVATIISGVHRQGDHIVGDVILARYDDEGDLVDDPDLNKTAVKILEGSKR